MRTIDMFVRIMLSLAITGTLGIGASLAAEAPDGSAPTQSTPVPPPQSTPVPPTQPQRDCQSEEVIS